MRIDCSLSLVTLVVLGAACADSPSAPNANEVLLSPDSTVELATTSVNTWYLASTHYKPYMMLESTADAITGNCCWVRFNNLEPRIPFENLPGGGDENAIDAWDMNYEAIAAAVNAIHALDGGVELAGGVDARERTRAAALFALAGAHTNLALLFDSAFVITNGSIDGEQPSLRGYAEVRDSALALWDELIALTEHKLWQWDATTLPLADGPPTAARLHRIARTMAARTLVLSSRNAAQNNTFSQWARILAYADGGITGTGLTDMDFAIMYDMVDWRDYIKLYGAYADRFRVDQRLIHRMAPNIPEKFSGLGNQPLPVPLDDRLAIANLPCTNDPLPCTEGITADYVYIGTVVGDPDRGLYMQSPFWHRRYVLSSWMVADGAIPWAGSSVYVLAAENDLMIAEALARTHRDLTRAAALVNKTHVLRGGLPPVGATVAEILEGVEYERDVELLNTGGIALFDRRRVDGLQPGTIRHFPVPGRVLESLGKPWYTYGGVGQPVM